MTNLNGPLLLAYLLYANVAFAGAALFYWATPLAERYNAWTTRIRQRFPNINERPSPNNAQLNVKIIASSIGFAVRFLLWTQPTI